MKLLSNKFAVLGLGVGLFMVFYFLVCYPKAESLKVMDLDIKRKSMELREESSIQKDLKSLQDEKVKLQKDARKME